MDREIKFRGKSERAGAWFYGYLYMGLDRSAVIAPPNDINHPVRRRTLGQYTGMRDKHGREIYEGDFVRVWVFQNVADPTWLKSEVEMFSLSECKGEIINAFQGEVWVIDYDFVILDKNGTHHPLSAMRPDQRLSHPIHEISVIGNRHDNPDLLEDIYG